LNDETFLSKSLGRRAPYRVSLPVGYVDSRARFPVLYLLHGLYGDRTNWSQLTKLADYARSERIIIVMPDAANSWYMNSQSNAQDQYENLIYRDLIAEVDMRYRTIPERKARAVAGLSMGGYGALKFSLKYPELFVCAASMTGALSAPLDLGDQVAEFRDDLLKAFGAPGDSCREQNDVFSLARDADPALMPYLYLDCGVQDSFLATNRDFVALLRVRKIAYEYHEYQGGHEWEYWDRRLPSVLHVLSEHFDLSGDSQ
jgi:putative tributyrin esterase